MKFAAPCALLLVLALAQRGAAQEVRSEYGGEVLRFGPPALALPARIDQRKRALDGDLEALAAHGEGRVLRGALYAGLGAGALATGFFFAQGARTLLYLVGVTTLTQGIAELALVPDPGKLGRAYRRMPVLTAEQLRARFRFGEEALSLIARGQRRARIVGGTVTMAAAAAYIPLQFWAERRADPSYRFGDTAFDFVAIAISTANFVSGLLVAVSQSEAEQRAAAYRMLRERNERKAPHELERLARGATLEVGPTVRGATIAARLRF